MIGPIRRIGPTAPDATLLATVPSGASLYISPGGYIVADAITETDPFPTPEGAIAQYRERLREEQHLLRHQVEIMNREALAHLAAEPRLASRVIPFIAPHSTLDPRPSSLP